MKRIKFRDEAERLNVPIEAIRKALEKMAYERKVNGVIDAQNEEIIYYELEEKNRLVDHLSSNLVSINELARELNLEPHQVNLMINNLLSENRIKGTFTSNGSFVTDKTMEKMIAEAVDKVERIDVHELSGELQIPKKEIEFTILKLSEQIVHVITPYTQIGLVELSRETKKPERFILTLLKTLISEGKIAGSLDMVNHILIIERAPKMSTQLGKSGISREQRVEAVYEKPSAAWYLVPLFLGLLGGLIGYIAVKDDDTEMAKNLLYFGIAISAVNILILWGTYLWWWSILSRLFR